MDNLAVRQGRNTAVPAAASIIFTHLIEGVWCRVARM